MSECTFSQQLGAYYDGELDPVRRGEVERHLAQCADCAGGNAANAVDVALAGRCAAPRLSQISLRRVHRRVESVMDEGLLWTARVLSGIAAAVLIVGSIWLVHMGGASDRRRRRYPPRRRGRESRLHRMRR